MMRKPRKTRRSKRMSRYMQMTDSYRSDVKTRYMVEFSEILDKYLASKELPDGKLSFIRDIPSIKKKAVVYFTAVAWAKMIAVINEFSKEVAWHGLVKKLEHEDDKPAYLIYDIVVYPQTVTGATVNTDQEEYEKWLNSFDDDTFNDIKMQGHSHVNMGVTPSAVDCEHKENIIRQLTGDMFYIFMIWNKQFKHHITIYDFGENIMFDDGDVEVKLYDNVGGLDEFIASAKELVKDKVWNSSYYKNDKDKKDKHEETKSLPEPQKIESKKSEPIKSEEKPRTPYSSFHRDNACYYEDDDDYDNPYSAFGYRGGMYGY